MELDNVYKGVSVMPRSNYEQLLAECEAANAVAGYDALAYDHVSSSPTLGRSVDGLIPPAKLKVGKANGVIIDARDVANGTVLIPGTPEWYAVNTVNGIIKPTYLQKTRVWISDGDSGSLCLL